MNDGNELYVLFLTNRMNLIVSKDVLDGIYESNNDSSKVRVLFWPTLEAVHYGKSSLLEMVIDHSKVVGYMEGHQFDDWSDALYHNQSK